MENLSASLTQLTKESIPQPSGVAGWKDVEIQECGEELVQLNNLQDHGIVVDSQYFIQGISHATEIQYVREGVKNALLIAASALPKGYKLVIWDAWRPLEVQQALFDSFYTRLEQENKGKLPDELTKLTQTYVSLPSDNPSRPSPHYTGGAVDLSILGSDGKPLNMGVPFDHFGPESAINYYESENADPEVKLNRRLLYAIMRIAGFSSYGEEYWHWDLGNQFEAKREGKPYAIYGGVSLKKD